MICAPVFFNASCHAFCIGPTNWTKCRCLPLNAPTGWRSDFTAAAEVSILAAFRKIPLLSSRISAFFLGSEVVHLIELKTSVVRQELAAIFRDQLRGRRIPDLDFVSQRWASGSEEDAEKQAHQKRGCASSSSASWRTQLPNMRRCQHRNLPIPFRLSRNVGYLPHKQQAVHHQHAPQLSNPDIRN